MVVITLMEGSFGTQLTKYVGDTIDGDPLWSARFLVTNKEDCILAHRDLVRAGTDILTTGSYQASLEGFKKHLGLDEKTALATIKNSVYFAKEAIRQEEKETGKKLNILVAGSVGPYGAFLHDGSDYTGAYSSTISVQDLMIWHRPRMQALIEAGAELLGFETIPAMIEAVALLTLLKEFPKHRAWLSFSCKDEQSISSGESLYEVAIKCWEIGSGQLIAIGVNCMDPSWVKPLFQKLRKTHPQIPLMAYPNSGEVFDTSIGRWLDKKTSLSVTDYTEEWLNMGVTFIGGCCRTNDKDLIKFREEIEKWKSKNLNN